MATIVDEYGNIVDDGEVYQPPIDNGDHNRFPDPVYNDQSGGNPIPYTPPVDNGDHNRFPAVATGNHTGLPTGTTGAFTDLLKTLGLTNDKTGAVDWSKILGLAAGATTLAAGANAQYNPKTPTQLLAMQPSNTPKWSEGQIAAMQVPMQAGNQLARRSAVFMPSPIVPGQKYAEGGEVQGPLSAMPQEAFAGAVTGAGGGQDDLIDARLSAGEYVMDAETVAMLGDGDNAAGARKLDELRAQLRAHKRGAPDDEIAPPAEGPLSYMGGQNG